MQTNFSNSFAVDRRLFRSEIRASLAHADALFRAGILMRQETERIKNGLWTILKRADFDRHYFDSFPSTDVFAFVEARLFQLINETADKLKIARNRDQRVAVALRLYLREENQQILELIENLSQILYQTENATFRVFSEMFDRDREVVEETRRRINRMPVTDFDYSTNESLIEFDFAEIARDLAFESISPNSFESAQDRDFCLEFIGAASLIMLHLSRMANEILFIFPNLTSELREVFEALRARAAKIFGFQAALFPLVQAARLKVGKDLQEIDAMIFETADIVKSCLQATISFLYKMDIGGSPTYSR